ncbi:MAG: PAS domain S-box protein [Nitrospira sp.]
MTQFTVESDRPVILIVDNNPTALYAKNQLLSRQGYRVINAGNGTDAFTLAAAKQPDLVLLDVNLPNINGFDVCRYLKTQSETQFIKVLQTSTARISATDRVKSLVVGADAHLVEPVEEEELLRTVRALLKLAQQERENRQLIQKLSHIQRQLLDATEAAVCKIWDWNMITGKLEWLGEHEKATGILPGGLTEKTQAFTDLLHPDDRARVRQKLENLMAQRETRYVDEYRVIHPDGAVQWMSGTGRFYYDDRGEAVRMTGVIQGITERHHREEALRLAHDELEERVAACTAELENANECLRVEVTDRQRAEAALRASEDRFRGIFNQTLVGMAEIDLTGRFVSVNPRYCQIVGRSAEELCGGLRMQDITYPDDLPADLSLFGKAVQEGVSFLIEKRYIRPDRSHVWVNMSVSAIKDASGQVANVVAALLDITGRKQVEDAVRSSEARFRMLAEAMPHFVWHTDEHGETEFENQRWYDYTGLTHETTRHGGWLMVQHPDDAPRLADAWKKAVQTGEECDAETRFKRAADGAYRWFHVRGAPVRDSEGRIRSWVGTCTDIHDRKEAELALRESEERYRATFANAAVGIAHIGLDGRFLQFNDSLCTITGYSREELLTRTFADITSPGDLKAEWVQARRVLEGGIETYSMEKRYLRRDGSLIWVHKTVSLLRDAHRKPLHFISIIEDIHDRKQAEEALREVQGRLQRWNEELEQAVNMKTAELRQSQDRLRALTSELNLAEQRERKRLATELHDHLQQMLVVGKLTIGQGKRAASGVPAWETVLKKVDGILSDALTYSRTLVAELSPPVLRDHGLTASLKWLAEYMKKKHEQTVTVVVPDIQGLNLPEEQRVLLFQSVRELLINSAKHAGTGQAALTMEKRADDLCITVKDEGKGFDLAVAATAGVPSGEISSKFGLYSIQERMRALGGSFTIDSVPGLGTIATLILPLTRSAEDDRLHPPITESENAWATIHADKADSLTKGRMMVPVLLVDDHAMVRQGLRSVLDAYPDIQVIGEARDGAEAVKLVEKLRPQVVVMDINMPKMNGIEATMQIKTKWPETMIIGISVNVGDDNNEAMQRAGAATLLTKEAAVEQLHNAIVQAVGS